MAAMEAKIIASINDGKIEQKQFDEVKNRLHTIEFVFNFISNWKENQSQKNYKS